MTVHSILPFLMFEGDASKALDFYTKLFPQSGIDKVELYGPGGPAPEGSIKLARFTIGGQSVLCTDSMVKHAFTFTPSFSFFVECSSEKEVRRLGEALKVDGKELMPPANYGFSTLFTWVSDRFRVSWQLNCA